MVVMVTHQKGTVSEYLVISMEVHQPGTQQLGGYLRAQHGARLVSLDIGMSAEFAVFFLEVWVFIAYLGV